MPGRLNKWTDADDFKLLDLHGRGMKPDAIARTLGRSVESVRKRLAGITMRKKSLSA
jgi:hypothetical protein